MNPGNLPVRQLRFLSKLANMSDSSNPDKFPNAPAKPPKAPGMEEWADRASRQVLDNLNRAREQERQNETVKPFTPKDPGVQEFGDRCARETLEKLNRAYQQATANLNPAGEQKK